MQDFCVVGAGRMGASIAGQLVLQGARVALFDRSDYDRYDSAHPKRDMSVYSHSYQYSSCRSFLDLRTSPCRKKGYEIMRADMKELEQRGLILPADKDAALARISLVENHHQCVQAKVVVEAIFEDLDAKRSLFAALEAAAAMTGANPVLSSNSMNYSIGQITSGVTSSARVVCGLRFLFPVFFMRPVEVSGHELLTDDSLSPDMSHLFASLRSFGFEPFYKSFPKPSMHGGQYQGSCRRTLGQHEVQLYEGEQARVVRTRRAEIEKAGGVVSRPAQGEVAWVKGERDLIVECLICMESTDNALFAPCGHRYVACCSLGLSSDLVLCFCCSSHMCGNARD